MVLHIRNTTDPEDVMVEYYMLHINDGEGKSVASFPVDEYEHIECLVNNISPMCFDKDSICRPNIINMSTRRNS